MKEGFEGTAGDFLVFFRALRVFKIKDTDLDTKIQLLRKLTARKRLKYHRDGEAYIKDKQVLKIEREDSTNENL